MCNDEKKLKAKISRWSQSTARGNDEKKLKDCEPRHFDISELRNDEKKLKVLVVQLVPLRGL